MNVNRQWLLAKRPHGMVTRENFEYREVPIPEPADGEYWLREAREFVNATTPVAEPDQDVDDDVEPGGRPAEVSA